MKSNYYETNYLPTENQQLLLKAALMQNHEALEAWESLKTKVDLDHMDPASVRLLPMTYRNLLRLGVDDPGMKKMKGLHRYHWCRNQVLFHRVKDLLDRLQQMNIDCTLLKGTALTIKLYKDYGLRPMNDFDLLIPERHAAKAVKMVMNEGWRARGLVSRNFPDVLFKVTHGYGFTNSQNQQFDLHWHVFPQCCYPGADDDFWKSTEEVRWDGYQVKVLSPADQLLHTCVHGAAWRRVPPIQWVPDAYHLITHPESHVDWNRLLDMTRKTRLIIPLREGLSFLKNTIKCPVPTEVIETLNRERSTWMEKQDFKIRTTPSSRQGIMMIYLLKHYRYSRKAENRNFMTSLATFPKFMKQIWQVKSTTEMIKMVIRKSGYRKTNES